VVVERAIALIDQHPDATVACCGLAFKANIDDLRESPAVEIATHLAERFGSRIKVIEPNIRELPKALDELGVGMLSIDEALMECQIAIVLVDHDEFKAIPLASRRHLDVIDTRGIWQDMPRHVPAETGSGLPRGSRSKANGVSPKAAEGYPDRLEVASIA
jgi:UDP-N-acetyl-D-mannosaminuronic acid dehydrogenase